MKSKKIADVYVTKWWATKGVLLVKGAKIIERFDEKDPGLVPPHHMACWGRWHSGEFFMTYKEACDRVEELARRKIISLEKSIVKIKGLWSSAACETLMVTELKDDRYK